MFAVSQTEESLCLLSLKCLLSFKPNKTSFCCLSNRRKPMSHSLNFLLSLKPKESYACSLEPNKTYVCCLSIVYCLSNRRKFVFVVSQTEENSFLLSLKLKEYYVSCLSNRRKPMSAVSQLSAVSQTEKKLTSAVSQSEGILWLLYLEPKKTMSAVSQFYAVSQTEGNVYLFSLKLKETYVCCFSNQRKLISALLVFQPACGYHTTIAKQQRNINTHRTRAIQPMK